MKDQKSALVLLAVISLIAIVVVVTSGFFKKNNLNNIKKEINAKVLGDTFESQNKEHTPLFDMEKVIGDTFQNTKDVAGEKVEEVQKTVVTTVEKEISNLTKSQIEALKLQICRDWGVVPTPP